MPRLMIPAVPAIALGSALLLTGCNTPPAGNDAAMQNAAMANDMTADALANADEQPVTTTTTVEDEASAPAVEVVNVPTPAPATPASAAAPLEDAAAIEQAIATGTGITRVRQPDGWAWMRDGHVIRTASGDGHRVAYFRNGASSPYLVQQDGRSYAYSGGHITRQYDAHGRATQPDAQHQREAQQLEQDANHHRQSAAQASRSAPRTPSHGTTDNRDRATSDQRSTHRPDQPSQDTRRTATDTGRRGGGSNTTSTSDRANRRYGDTRPDPRDQRNGTSPQT